MSPLILLVRTVRRRWMVRHLIEFAAVGLGAGCAVAITLIGIEISQGHSAVSLSIGLPLLGMCVGVLLALRSAPSQLTIVQQIDRASGGCELLTTAWQLSHKDARSIEDTLDDPWHRSIVSQAMASAAVIQPSAVLTRQIGKRGWSVIMSMACAASVLAALSVIGEKTPAQASENLVEQPVAQAWTRWTPQNNPPSNAMARSSTVEAKAEAMVDSRPLARRDVPDPQSLTPLASGRSGNQVSGRDAAGGGESHSRSSVEHVADWTTQPESTARLAVGVPALVEINFGNDDFRADNHGKTLAQASTVDLASPVTEISEPGADDSASAVPYRLRSIYSDYFSANH